MMTDFYRVFGDDADVDSRIPREILDELNKELPENLMYMQDDNGDCKVVLRPEFFSERINLTTQFALDPEKDSALRAKLKIIPRENWDQYFYRLQKRIPVKNVKLGNDHQQIPLEWMVGNPLHEKKSELVECVMYPSEFPDPIEMLFECENGESVSVSFRQQPYDSFTEIKFSNINFPALQIDMFLYSPLADQEEEDARTNQKHPVSVTYSVTPTKADSVSDAVKALHIFSGLFAGTTKVNGQIMISEEAQKNFDQEKMEDVIAFWTTAQKLEERLKVRFRPDAKFPMDDSRFFAELDTCLLQKKQIVWRHPFDSFHVNHFKVADDGKDVNSIIGSGSVSMQFMEGPISAELLGAEFEIYSQTTMSDMVVTNIQWEDETRQCGEVYITDAPGKTWTLKRLYITKETADSM